MNYGARIVLAHGLDPMEYAAVDGLPGSVASHLTAEARKVLDKLAGDLLREGIHSHSEVRQGTVAEMLVDVARQYEAGLIVIGTKGMEGAGPVAVGAIAEQLVRLAPCPVLAVAADWNAGPHRPAPGGPVLLAVERNEASAAAAATAYSLASHFSAAIAVAARPHSRRNQSGQGSLRCHSRGIWPQASAASPPCAKWGLRLAAQRGSRALHREGRRSWRGHGGSDCRKPPMHSRGRSKARERDAGDLTARPLLCSLLRACRCFAFRRKGRAPTVEQWLRFRWECCSRQPGTFPVARCADCLRASIDGDRSIGKMGG